MHDFLYTYSTWKAEHRKLRGSFKKKKNQDLAETVPPSHILSQLILTHGILYNAQYKILHSILYVPVHGTC